MKSFWRICFLGPVMFSLVASAGEETSPRPSDASRRTEWKLPENPGVSAHKFPDYVTNVPLELLVTADRRYVIFHGYKLTPAFGRRLESYELRRYVLDAESEEVRDLFNLLWGKRANTEMGMITLAEPSLNGKWLLVTGTNMTRGKSAVHVVELSKMKPHMIARISGTGGSWVGEYIGMCKVSRSGRLGPIELFATSGNKTGTLKIRGIVGAGNPHGDVLIVQANPDDPTKPIKVGPGSIPMLQAVRPDGKVLRKLIPGDEVGGMIFGPKAVVVSASGNYVALQHAIRNRDNPKTPPKLSLRIYATLGKEKRIISEPVFPLAVTDAGEVYTIGAKLGQNGTEVKLWDKEGKSQTVIENVRAAAVAGDELFYITGTIEKPMLKAIPLKKPGGK